MSGPAAGARTVQPVYNRFQDELDRTYRESRKRRPAAGGPGTDATSSELNDVGRDPQTADRSIGNPDSAASGSRAAYGQPAQDL